MSKRRRKRKSKKDDSLMWLVGIGAAFFVLSTQSASAQAAVSMTTVPNVNQDMGGSPFGLSSGDWDD